MIKGKYAAVFPGTFDPYTVGHADIAERAARLLGSVLIAVGYNEHKEGAAQAASERAAAIAALYADRDDINAIAYYGLTADLAKSVDAKAIVRGVRNAADFDYEQNLGDVNREVLGVETVYIPARPELSYVSGTMVRELTHFGYDASRFIAKK